MKKHNFRKGILAAAGLVLVAAISVSATLAYLTANTSPVNNTFTAGGGIDITINEPNYDQIKDKVFLPGETFAKDPSVQNTTTASDSPVYVVASLTYTIKTENGALQTVDYETFVNTANAQHAIIKTGDNEGFNTSYWTQIKATDDNDKNDYFVYGQLSDPTKLEKNVDSENIFDTVTISAQDTKKTQYQIIINAYAVNADGGLSESVFTELAGLTGNKITVASDNLSFVGA